MSAIGGCLLVVLSVLTFAASPSGADEISDKRAEAQRIAAQLDEAKEDQIQLVEQYNQATLKLGRANDDIAAAQVRVDAVGKEYEQRKGEARRFAVEGYIHGNDSPSLDVVLTSESDKAPQKKGYIEAANGNRRDAVDQLQATRHKLDQEITNLDRAKGDAQAATDKATEAKQAGDAAVAKHAELNNRVQGELGRLVQEEQARRAEEQRKANEARMAELREAEEARLAAAAPPTTAAPSTSTSESARTAPGPGSSAAPPPAPAPATNRPAPKPAPAPPSTPVPSSGKGGGAVAAAMSQLGVPYKWAGASPSTGFDCSGLVMWAYAQVGVSVPHSTYALWSATSPISMGEAQAGDLIFFYGQGHVGLYLGGGSVVHAPHTGDVVRVASVSSMPVSGVRRVR